MTNLDEHRANDGPFVCINKDCTNFGFGGRGHDIAEDDKALLRNAKSRYEKTIFLD
jgi:hypothetical protein